MKVIVIAILYWLLFSLFNDGMKMADPSLTMIGLLGAIALTLVII